MELSDIEKIISIYNEIQREEDEADFAWSCDEEQTGISRYNALTFKDICKEVLRRFNHRK